MPELPEVETVALGLRKRILGKVISRVRILRKESVAHPSNSRFCRNLKGQRVEGISRRGKYLLISLSNGSVLGVHLRMSGRLIAKKKNGSADRFLRVQICFDDNSELHFEDMRVFGRLWLVDKDEHLEEVIRGLKTLGVEPLSDLNSKYLIAKLKNKKQPIKNSLLDQRIIAGIGNIYADESLYLAGINPLQMAGSLSKPQADKLVQVLKQVLSSAIKSGGSTLRDYKTADGVNGNYQNEAWVYGQTGKKCRLCRTEIERVRLAGRSTHFCPQCQKGKKSKLIKLSN